jgi:hypothetical protein
MKESALATSFLRLTVYLSVIELLSVEDYLARSFAHIINYNLGQSRYEAQATLSLCISFPCGRVQRLLGAHFCEHLDRADCSAEWQLPIADPRGFDARNGA